MAQHARTDSGGQTSPHGAAQQTALVVRFMAAYAAAAAAGTADWATFSDVKDMFADDAVLVTQDRQVFQGKPQVLRRLDQGAQHPMRRLIVPSDVCSCRPIFGYHGVIYPDSCASMQA